MEGVTWQEGGGGDWSLGFSSPEQVGGQVTAQGKGVAVWQALGADCELSLAVGPPSPAALSQQDRSLRLSGGCRQGLGTVFGSTRGCGKEPPSQGVLGTGFQSGGDPGQQACTWPCCSWSAGFSVPAAQV